MPDRPIEPMNIALMVDEYAATEHDAARRYENRELLDESGIYSLHELAARIYQHGFNDGRATEALRSQGSMRRERDRARAAQEEGDRG